MFPLFAFRNISNSVIIFAAFVKQFRQIRRGKSILYLYIFLFFPLFLLPFFFLAVLGFELRGFTLPRKVFYLLSHSISNFFLSDVPRFLFLKNHYLSL
jgi:hypothetical protein